MSDLSLERPDWSQWFIRLAYVTAQRATCRRKRVGSLIVDHYHRIISSGYNGAPAGLPDCLTAGCDIVNIGGRDSCVRTLHSESNAIDYAGKDARGCVLYTTAVPCRPCALRVIQAGIYSVVFSEWYESQGTHATRALLEQAGVVLHQVSPGDDELAINLKRAIGEIP